MKINDNGYGFMTLQDQYAKTYVIFIYFVIENKYNFLVPNTPEPQYNDSYITSLFTSSIANNVLSSTSAIRTKAKI